MLEESFRLFLSRTIADDDGKVVFCERWVAAYLRRYAMYLEISNPMDYHAALYIRLSKEDESEGDVYKRQANKSQVEILDF